MGVGNAPLRELRVLAITWAVLGSCGCSRTPPPEAPSAGLWSDLPAWVRIVPTASDGTLYYVGSSSIAENAKAGVGSAVEDAIAQLAGDARTLLRSFYDKARMESGVQIAPLDYRRFSDWGIETFIERVTPAASPERTCYRECGGGAGEAGAQSPLHEGSAEDITGGGVGAGPVCSVFVLVSCDAGLWDRTFLGILEDQRAEATERGLREFSHLVDWMLRNRVPIAPG